MAWLAAAVVAGVAAYLVAWPAWRSYRAREGRDLAAERYLAWRGRAAPPRTTTREGMTGEERRRVVIGLALAAVGLASLVAFFAAS